MQDNRELMEFNEQARRMFTGHDAATVIGICVSLLVMLTGALVCIVCLDLLTMSSQFWLHLQTS